MPHEVGGRLESYEVDRVPREGIRAMSELLDDPTPIHLDTAAVVALGLGDRLVNQGPINLGYVSDMVTRAIPEGVILSLDMRLLSNVFESDRVVAGGEVTAIEPSPAGGDVLVCAVWLDRDDGVRAVAGTARVAVPRIY